MITTILFDLDGTLLPMDQDALIRAYMDTLAGKMAAYGYDPTLLIKSIWTGTGAMVTNDGSRTNESVFWDVFSQVYGRDVRADEPLFINYYENEFQQIRHTCAPDGRVPALIRQLQERGLRLILATNPLFPAIATHSRIRWAGLTPEDFVYITSYENSSHSKPNPDYYREILRKLGLRAEECLMVGNDVTEDMVARTLGMQVFLLTDCLINKQGEDIAQFPHGSFPEFLDYIRSL